MGRESADVGHEPPFPGDPNFQEIVDFLRAGLGGATTTQGTGGTSATTKPTTKNTTTKETTKETTTTTTKFDPTNVCPAPGTMVDWKGAKNSRILFRSTTGMLMRVNFFNNAGAYDIVNEPYL